ncbi:MAG: GTP cyclohydrolase II [Alphaproteobacteria bacterium]|nr:MAG: GTP cyclohydrolase II [Alphaproteobacteria bacterium]
MAIEPRPEKNKANKPLLDHNIVTVERAAGELRRGLPVVISDGQDVILMQSAELLTDTWIDRFQDLTETPPVIGLTYHRANILRVLPRGGDVALIKLSEHMIEYGAAAMIQSMADPADDLRQPMKGPFHVADQDAGKIHAAGLKLCKIAKLLPAALFSGLIPTEDGPHWAAQKGLLQASASDILVFDHRDGQALRFVTSARVPLAGAAKTTMVAYRPDDGGTEHFALIIGDPNRHDPVLTRVHSECFTGDLLGSLKCDCGDQLNGAIKHMQNAGGGVLLYLAQEGRGIGLINKLRAYQLQDQGFDTVDANERLGFHADERLFDPAAQMLKILGFDKVRLLTNNPLKVDGLEKCGVTVTQRVPHSFPSNAHNDHYLQTKKKRSGHLLS